MYSYLKHVCYKMKIKKPVFLCDNTKSAMTKSAHDFLPELQESFIFIMPPDTCLLVHVYLKLRN